MKARDKVSEDCWGSVQLMPCKDLLALALGKVDAVLLMKEELASRGLNKKGVWVGFEKAEREWGVK